MKRTFTMKQALAESSEDLDESSHEPIPSTLKKQMQFKYESKVEQQMAQPEFSFKDELVAPQDKYEEEKQPQNKRTKKMQEKGTQIESVFDDLACARKLANPGEDLAMHFANSIIFCCRTMTDNNWECYLIGNEGVQDQGFFKLSEQKINGIYRHRKQFPQECHKALLDLQSDPFYMRVLILQDLYKKFVIKTAQFNAAAALEKKEEEEKILKQ